MSAIFSVQNLQTFLRRKNFRPPSRGGPPGPERPPPPPPPKRGRSPPERGPSPEGRDGRSPAGAAAFVSSVITLLLKISCQWPVVSRQLNAPSRFAAWKREQTYWQLLLGRCRSFLCRRRGRWSFFHHDRGLGAHLLARVAQLFDLLQALLLFVDANREEFDHRLGNPQPPLQFVDHRARAFDGH